MTLTPTRRTLLPLADVSSGPSHARGKRSPVTCRLKCGDACAHPVPNESDNDYFPDIASMALSRRGLLGAGAVSGLALTVAAPAAARTGGLAAEAVEGGLSFTAIAPVPKTVDDVTVPDGYRWDALVRWGDPLFDDAPAFDVMNQSESAQEQQFGYNCDYLDLIPLGTRGTRAVLVANHEYTNEAIMFPPTSDPAQIAANKRTAIAAHGLSVVSVKRRSPGRPWRLDPSRKLNRRITGMTEFTVDGPAAGSDLLKTKDDPTGTRVLGTLNNCAGGTTPWGTVLSGEENFNQYFVANASARNSRYGIASSVAADNRQWWTVEPRFDARTPGYENEVHRHGWVVEIDPMDPESTPVKHTALGRFKHEAATIRIAPSGRVVAYSGDDERFDYIYKFVSRRTYDDSGTAAARARNMTLLSEGDLYVAKFTGDSPAVEITGTGALPSDGAFDGSGEWLPLVQDGVSKVPGMSVAEVLVFTRLAADAVGATKMDRPEDVECHPQTGAVYVALTNNTQRGLPGRAPVDEANPRTPNREGHVIEMIEAGDDPTSLTFGWKILLVCGVPGSAGTYFGGYTGPVSPISCPDNVAFDTAGNLWISTDGQPGTIQFCDALHKVTLTGPDRGKVEQFLAVPVEAETCGPVIHDQDGLVFVCVQHPGEDGTWAAQRSYFPDYLEAGAQRDGKWGGPRPSVVQVYRR